MNNSIDVLKKTFSKNKEVYLKYLKDIIAIKTEVLGHGRDGGFEYEGQLHLESLLKELGFEVMHQQIKEENIRHGSEQMQEGVLGHNYEHPHPRYNLIATLSGTDKNSKSLLFNGHIDTMPAGDTSLWTYNPYKGTVVGDKLYGLGTADMKGGLMASIVAVKLLQDAGLDIKGDVKILSVVDEEGGGNGTLNACLEGIEADYGVVAECSEGTIQICHMGFVMLDIALKGVSVHAGKKYEGVNAIEKALLLIDGFRKLEAEWQKTRKHPLLPSPSVNIGKIEGGTAMSSVPNSCRLGVCAHFLPDTNVLACKQELLDVIEECVQKDSFLQEHPPVWTVTQQGQAFQLNDQRYIDTIQNVSQKLFQKEMKISGSSAGLDARNLMNIAKIPTAIIGPATLEQCHTIDEFVYIEDYFNNILLYAGLILEINR